MIFEITRTNDWGNNGVAEYNIPNIVNKWIAYKVPWGYSIRSKWYLELNSLEELTSFLDSILHPVVITGNEIEIYDDYRE